MADTDSRYSSEGGSNRQRKASVVVATSAKTEVVSRESFARRLEGMNGGSSSSSSPAVACVNCHKVRGYHNCSKDNNSSCSGSSKRRSAFRNRGKSNNYNNSNVVNRKKQQQHQYQQQQQKVLMTPYTPIVVHLKDSSSFPSAKHVLARFRQSSLDADSDASSSRSTDDDFWTGSRQGDEEQYDATSSSLSEDLASSPETVSHLQNHYQNHARFKADRAKKAFRGNSRLVQAAKARGEASNQNGSFNKSNTDSSSRKNLTAFLSEIEKVHRKDTAKDIAINLSDSAPDSKRSNLLNDYSQCDDCKGEELNNSCKCLLKDVEVKRKIVAESDNVELICNDLYTSNEKLSEESTDESDTSDKASVFSSSDNLSDDARVVSPPAPDLATVGSGNARKFTAEELEDLAEYTTGSPLIQYGHGCPPASQCLSCTNSVSSLPYYYYPYYDASSAYRFHHHHHSPLFDFLGHSRLFHHNHYIHRHSYFRHRPFNRRNLQQNHRHLRYQPRPLQQFNHWVIQRPRLVHEKVSSTTTTSSPDRSSDIEEKDTKTVSSSSSSTSATSTASLPSFLSMVTTPSNTVVTVCANGASKSAGAGKLVVTSTNQKTLSLSNTRSYKKSSNETSSSSADDKKDKEAVAKPTTTTTSSSKSRRNRNRNSKNRRVPLDSLPEPHDPHKHCSIVDSVFMDLTGMEVSFSVSYPGDEDFLGWPSVSSITNSSNSAFHNNQFMPSFWVPSTPSYFDSVSGKSLGPASFRHSSGSKRLSSTSSSLTPPASTSTDSDDNGSELQTYELAVPSNRPWINAGSPDKDVPAAVFTVMCYNVLSDKLCTKAMYGYCPTWALSWDYRKKGIMNDIISGNADIITLQEVETEQYYGLFLPELLKRGYDGVFLPKSRVRTMNSDKEKMSVDGCAIFYKKTKFEKVNEHHVEFSQLATKDGASNTDSDMINRVSTKDNIAIVAMLRTKPAAYEASPVPAPKGLSQLIMVSTAHIHWDPALPDVKLVQTIMLVEELRKFIKEASVQFRPNAPPPSVDADMCSSLPLILCGDFNSLPDSGVFEYLSKGKLDTRHRDFEGQNYKAFMKDRNENGILNHNFNLTSAYKDVIPFTNYTFDFKGVIDYIFYSGQHIRLHGVMGLQDEEWFRANKIVGCPHPFVPSDHFPLYAEFSLPALPTAGPSSLLSSGPQKPR